jgi:hypothetical protein
MSEPLSIESILGQVGKQEKEYDWLGAAKSYNKALVLVQEQDFSKLGDMHERLSYAFYKAAMQAESQAEFKDRMRQAAADYEKAKEFYGHLSEPVKTARMLRCDAMKAYVGYWLSSEVPEKKRLINECWRLTKEALKVFEEAGDAWEYGETYNQLSNSVVFGFCYEWDFQARDKMVREVLEHGEKAIRFLSANADSY